MKFIKTINKWLYTGERTIAIITFISMMLIMFIQVFFRYVIHSSLAWSEEAMRYLFVVTSFFGAACASYEHKHVVIDFLGTIATKAIKDEGKRETFFSITNLFVCVVCCGFFIYIGRVMLDYAVELQVKNHMSTAMMMPLHYVGYAIVISLFCCAIHFFLEIFITIDGMRGKKKAVEGGETA